MSLKQASDNTMKNASNIINCITNKFNNYIFSEEQNNDTSLKFIIKTVDGINVGNTRISLEQKTIPTFRRSNNEKQVNAIYITWIGIEDAYQRQGLATALFLYAICIIYKRYVKMYTYIFLEDATNTNTPLDYKHIYRTLGFTPYTKIEMVSNRLSRVKSQQQYTTEERITTVEHAIDVIGRKYLNKYCRKSNININMSRFNNPSPRGPRKPNMTMRRHRRRGQHTSKK
jgi:ribosomal protein S18 acetylase RimI-like enzyme